MEVRGVNLDFNDLTYLNMAAKINFSRSQWAVFLTKDEHV